MNRRQLGADKDKKRNVQLHSSVDTKALKAMQDRLDNIENVDKADISNADIGI